MYCVFTTRINPFQGMLYSATYFLRLIFKAPIFSISSWVRAFANFRDSRFSIILDSFSVFVQTATPLRSAQAIHNWPTVHPVLAAISVRTGCSRTKNWANYLLNYLIPLN